MSAWLFAGQSLAWLGFSVYSALTGNAVFLVVNLALTGATGCGRRNFEPPGGHDG